MKKRGSGTAFEEETIAAKVPLADMVVDNYQGHVSDSLVEFIAKNWDDSAVGTIILNLRKNGQYAVLDGQHRVLAAKKRGIQELPAYCFIDKTYEEEASLFVKLNTKHTVSPFDKFRANLLAGKNPEKTINQVVTELGLMVSRDNNGTKSIRSIVVLYKLHNDFGVAHLKAVLGTLQSAWSAYNDSRTYSSEALGAVSQFIFRYPEADIAKLIAKLKAYSPATVQGMAVQKKDPGQMGWMGWGKAITLIYNKGIRFSSAGYLPLDRWNKVKYTPAGKAKMKSLYSKPGAADHLKKFHFKPGVPPKQQPSVLMAAAKATK